MGRHPRSAVGTLFLLRNLDIVWISFHHVWPVVLVALGVYLVWQAIGPRRSLPSGAADSVGRRAHDGTMAGLEASRDLRTPGASAGDG